MTTHKEESENFITGDLDQPTHMSDLDQDNIDLLQMPNDNSIIKDISSLNEVENEIDSLVSPSEITNQKIDMLNDCMALNRITIKSIQTLSTADLNSNHGSLQSLISSTSASNSSILTTSSDETLLPEENKDKLKLNENLKMKNEKQFFKDEDKEDANDNNLESNSFCGKELFVVVLNDGNGTAVVQVGDENSRSEKAADKNPLGEKDDESENVAEPDDIEIDVKNVRGLKRAGLRSVAATKKDELWKPPSSITRSGSNFKKNDELKSARVKQNKSVKKKLGCKKCDREFDYSSAVNLHIRKNTGERFYKCPRCDFASYYLASIKLHVRSHTGAKPFKCHTCRKKFVSSQALLKHKYDCHLLSPKTNSLRCRFCKEAFEDKQALKTHVNSHKVGDFYRCSICNYKKKSSSSLESHMNKHSNNELFVCNECGQSFHQKGLLKEHWGFYHVSLLRKKMYKCIMCALNFVHFECLCRHTDTAHCKTSLKKKSLKKRRA